MKNRKKTADPVLPECGPVDEKGREIILTFDNVDITFGKGDSAVKAVKKASFCVYKGEVFSLVGESGSGKTTIGRAIIRANRCAAGEIRYKGVPISGKLSPELERALVRNIQMVFQDPAASLNERATVEHIVSEGLHNFRLYENSEERASKVEKILQEVGLLPEHLSRYSHEFSGGQRQRIGLARAMVMEPEFVVADEPISALDVSVRAQVLNLMKKFQKERGVTYLFIAHDLSVVRFISDRIGVIYRGTIVEIAEAEELFAFPMHPYTRSLISAIPIPDPVLEREKVTQVYDPSAHDYSREAPSLQHIGYDHYVYGSPEEIREYQALREKGETPGPARETRTAEASLIPESLPGDTGSVWYTAAAFLLPPVGLVVAGLFKRFRYARSYRACRKGMRLGFTAWGCMTAFFLLLLLLVVL